MPSNLSANPIISAQALGFPWVTRDPFLFCAYHDDAYPAGNAQMGPKASLEGRNIGQDFSRKDGWSMYHGSQVPGFPGHPHRGFETVTIVRQGLIDHSDSLGAAARFGGGDVQWLTAGQGIVHAEMFPLLHTDQSNPLELFQIWLNLPARSKMVKPHFTMHWSEQIARTTFADAQGRTTQVAVVAGYLQDAGAVAQPPPDSWAASADNDVAIWILRMQPGAQWVLPAATGQATQRTLYFFKGASVGFDGHSLQEHAAIQLRADTAVHMTNGDSEAEFLLLQGKPINEPVAQYGPFVMNTQAEIHQAMADYRRTEFGGWPWPTPGPVHGASPQRFARHPDGRQDKPPDTPVATISA